MTNSPRSGLPIDIEGPIRAEVFVVAHDGTQPWLTGPDGARPWQIQTDGSHPLDLVREMAHRTMSHVDLVHSTSWRWDRQSVILSFVVVIPPEAMGDMARSAIARTDLARSDADQAPTDIGFGQVLEHGLRHLAWLVREDQVVKNTLNDAWKRTLAGYVPAPFEQLG